MAQAANKQPNVILIVTDDQGYGDLACNGNQWIKTPNIDQLNSESVRFSNFHSATTSSPTRSGIMSGKYCNKVGAWHTIKGREMLDHTEITLPQRLKSAGYSTAMFGKWHLGDSYPFRPQDRGFDETLTFDGGGVGQQPDYWENDYFDDTYFRNGKPEKFTGYCTDIWFSEALKYIEKSKNKPFFCYLSTNAPHSPYNVPEMYSSMYKDNQDIPNPNFYGMITNIDDNIGKLRAELKKMGLEENTIIIFMSDNGSSTGAKIDKKTQHVVSGYNAGMRGLKGSNYDGGHRVPFMIHWPKNNLKKGKEISTIASYIDIMPTVLNMCNVRIDNKIKFDGVNLLPLIKGKEWAERILFADTQREEFLIKGKDYSVMTNKWRLIGNVDQNYELYDMTNDVAQIKNVAAKYPEIVDKLNVAYEAWWKDVSQNADKYNCIKIGSKHEKRVRLNCHDYHLIGGKVAYSQESVRAGVGDNGFWAVEVVKGGDYEFELCRWPKESKLKMDEQAPENKKLDGIVNAYKLGKKVVVKKAKIKVGEIEKAAEVKQPSESVKFILKLEAGKTTVQTWLTDDENVDRGAYYVYVTKL